jgi:hypothetical protein
MPGGVGLTPLFVEMARPAIVEGSVKFPCASMISRCAIDENVSVRTAAIPDFFFWRSSIKENPRLDKRKSLQIVSTY